MAKSEKSAEKKKDKKEKKSKSEKSVGPVENGTAGEVSKRDPRDLVSKIAKPLADEKLSKKVLKLTKKAAKRKQLKLGVKEVIKAVRKDVKGVCIIAGDISPVDVISPLPVLCEDHGIPYIYVPSKEELGHAGLTKRSASCVLVLPKPLKAGKAAAGDDDDGENFEEAYQEVFTKVKGQQVVWNMQ